MTLLLLAASLAALAYGLRFAAAEGPPSWTASAVKTASTTLLVAYAIRQSAPGLIILGLAFGSAGDFALSRPGKPAFLVGMAAFALGHLAYVLAFWGWLAPTLTLAQIALLAATALLFLSTEGWLAPHTADLRAPVRAYTFIIGAMTALALLLAPSPGTPILRAGAALFLLSDILLALRLFRAKAPAPKRWLSLTLWPAYWIGQTLILRGSLMIAAS